MRLPSGRLSGLGAAAGAALTLWSAAAHAATIEIRISDLAFDPPTVSARAGDVIEWRNDDFIDHTATERGGRWDITVPPGKTGRVTVTAAGTMSYFCRFHPQMTGTVQANPGP